MKESVLIKMAKKKSFIYKTLIVKKDNFFIGKNTHCRKSSKDIKWGVKKVPFPLEACRRKEKKRKGQLSTIHNLDV